MLYKLNFSHSDKLNFPNSWCAYRELPNSSFAMCVCSWEACFFFFRPLDRNANSLPCVANYCFISRRAWDLTVLSWGGLLSAVGGCFLGLLSCEITSLPDPSLNSLCSRYMDPVIGTESSGHLCSELSHNARLFHTLFYEKNVSTKSRLTPPKWHVHSQAK